MSDFRTVGLYDNPQQNDRAESGERLGQTNDGVGWQADFDWVVTRKHARRILAGTYDKLWRDKSAAPCKTAPTYDLQEYVDLSIRRLLKEGTSGKAM